MGSGGCWGELIGEDEEAEEPEALAELLDGLFTFFIAFPTVLALQLWAFWYWRYRMNRGYYDELYLPQEVWDPKKARIEAEGKFRRKYFGLGPKVPIVVKKPRKKMFIALPGPFVFPAFPILAINFFQTGMVENGWALILECYKRSDTEEFMLANETMFTCIMPGILTISFVMCNMTLCCAMLWWFNINFRKASWEPLAAPTDAEAIEDPLFRLITKVRYNVLAKIPGYKRFILGPMWDRPRGEFMRPWDEVEEPARTERLLANPFIIFKTNSADAIDSLKLHNMARASGFHFRGICYDFYATVAQLTVAMIAGSGSLFIPQTPGAYGQMIAIITVQWGSCLYIGFTQPSVDRFDALVMTLQFGLEGVMTFLLLLGSLPDVEKDAAEGYQALGGYLGIVSMILPIFCKFYDAVIVQISAACRKDEFTWMGFAFAMISLLVSLPGLIIAFMGLEDVDLGDIEGALDETMGLVDTSMGDIAEGLGSLGAGLDGLGEIFSDLAWMQRPMPKHHKAAVVLQRHRRQRQMFLQGKQHRAAVKVQARVRGNLARKEWKKSAGSRPESLMELAKRAGSEAGLRPRQSSLVWLDLEVRRNMVSERVGRARDENLKRSQSIGTSLARSASMQGGSMMRDVRSEVARARAANKPKPGEATLRSEYVEGVGIVYTRARPSGDGGKEGLRESAKRLKRRSVKNALPAGMPVMPPVIVGAGGDFAEVVRKAQEKKRKEGGKRTASFSKAEENLGGSSSSMMARGLGMFGLSPGRSPKKEKSQSFPLEDVRREQAAGLSEDEAKQAAARAAAQGGAGARAWGQVQAANRVRFAAKALQEAPRGLPPTIKEERDATRQAIDLEQAGRFRAGLPSAMPPVGNYGDQPPSTTSFRQRRKTPTPTAYPPMGLEPEYWNPTGLPPGAAAPAARRPSLVPRSSAAAACGTPRGYGAASSSAAGSSYDIEGGQEPSPPDSGYRRDMGV